MKAPLESASPAMRLAYDLAYLGFVGDPPKPCSTAAQAKRAIRSGIAAAASGLGDPTKLAKLSDLVSKRAKVPFAKRPRGESDAKLKSMLDAIAARSAALSDGEVEAAIPPEELASAQEDACARLDEAIAFASAGAKAGSREPFAIPLWPVFWMGGDEAASKLLSTVSGVRLEVVSATFSREGACETSRRRGFGSKQFRERSQSYGIAVASPLPDKGVPDA